MAFKKERENEPRLTTHHVVGGNNREIDEKERWPKKKLLCTLSSLFPRLSDFKARH